VTESISSQQVDSDVACHACAYNLRGLSRDAVCPECARPVAESLKSRRLIDADSNWLRTVRWGVRFILLSGAIGVVDTIIREGGTWPGRLAGGAVAAFGVVLLTRREPGDVGMESLRTRWVARVAALAAVPASITYFTFDTDAYPRLCISLTMLEFAAGGATWLALLIWTARLLGRAGRRLGARVSYFTLFVTAAATAVDLVYYGCYLIYYNPLANQVIGAVESATSQAVITALAVVVGVGLFVTLIVLWLTLSSSIRATAIRSTPPDARVRHRQVDVFAIPRRVMWWMIIGLPILIVLIERVVSMFRRE